MNQIPNVRDAGRGRCSAMRASAVPRPVACRRLRLAACLVLPVLVAGCRIPRRAPDALDRIDPAGKLRFPVPAEVVHVPAPRPFACDRTDLTLRIDPERVWIEGEARLTLQVRRDLLEVVTFDFGPLEVSSVEDDAGFQLAWEHLADVERLRIHLAPPRARDERFVLRVRYRGRPAWGMHFLRDGPHPVVVTHGQPVENHHWFPCLERPDERTSFSLALEVPGHLATVGAGRLIAREDLADGWRRDRYRLDFAHPAYLVSLAVGPFAVETLTDEPLPILVHAPERDREGARAAFAEAGAITRFYHDLLGAPLPLPRLAHTLVPVLPAGAMENIGSIVYRRDRVLQHASVGSLHDPADIVAHETAHQWFGNLVSPATWADVWISEGFASYLHLLWVERARGGEAFRRWMRRNREDAMRADQGASRRPIVWASYRDATELFDGRTYGGAAWRLHMLRERFGAPAFQRALQLLLERGRGSSIDTRFVMRTFSEALGEDLEPFFDAWLHGGGHPELDVSWTAHEQRGRLEVDVRQVQGRRRWTRAVYETPLRIAVAGEDGRRVVFDLGLERRAQRFSLPLDFAPRWVRVDPDDALYATFRVEQPLAAWRAQLLEEPDPFGRLDAAEHLARLLPSAAADLRDRLAGELAERLAEDASWLVREGIAAHLAQPAAAAARDALLVAALYDAQAEVRLAATTALGAHEPTAVVATLRQILEREANPAVRAAALRAVGRARVPGATPLVRAGLAEREAPHAAWLRAAALDALAELTDAGSPDGDRLLDLVLPFLDPEHEEDPHVRAAAVATCERMTRRRPEARHTLERLLADPAPGVRRAAVLALQERLDPASLPRLIEAWRREPEPRVATAMIALGQRLNERLDRTVAALSAVR